jgi:osmotically-inducible protein OsmY
MKTRTRPSGSTEATGVIEEKLKSEPGLVSTASRLGQYGIQVTLTPNAVTLSGPVPSSDDRDKAVRVARSYAGDREVENHLSVQRPD